MNKIMYVARMSFLGLEQTGQTILFNPEQVYEGYALLDTLCSVRDPKKDSIVGNLYVRYMDYDTADTNNYSCTFMEQFSKDWKVAFPDFSELTLSFASLQFPVYQTGERFRRYEPVEEQVLEKMVVAFYQASQ